MKKSVLLVGLCAIAFGHPMGNFSVSHYARFDVRAGGVVLTYVLDLAELPTFELLRSWNVEASDRAAVNSRAEKAAAGWLAGLQISVNGRRVTPSAEKTTAVLSDGAGGLHVMRVAIAAALPAESGTIEYLDTNFAGRSGWKEIAIVPHEGVALEAASHGAEDRSRALEAYPSDATVAPPQDLRASFLWMVSHGAAKTAPLPAEAPRLTPLKEPARSTDATQPITPAGTVVRGDYLSRMLGGREITWGMILAGLCVAFGLGSMHALSPGHGKTIVAAYLVGSRGTLKHALFLGATVTFTHTASVFALGLGVLFFQKYVVPDKVIPVLGVLSGLSIVVIGAILLYQRSKVLAHAGRPHTHHHHEHHHHEHHHHEHHHHSHDGTGALTHTHDGHTHTHAPPERVTLASLIALGVSGGLVPCPSALVLLLSSIALGRAGLGLLLLCAFSAGLAVVLMAIGAMVLYARNLVPDRKVAGNPVFRYVPVFSAAVVTLLGLLMTAVSLGWVQPMKFLS